jgi:hypothetical protein
MGGRIAKIDQQAVTQVLGRIAFMSLNHRGTGVVIVLHHGPVVLGVELLGEGRRPNQVNEHDCQLPPLGLGRERPLGFRRFCLSALRASCRLLARRAPPHQHRAVLVHRHRLDLDQLELHIFQRRLVQGEVPAHDTVGQPALLPQYFPHLPHDCDDIHHWPSANALSNAWASCKSLVSKPSVNQP